MKKSRRLTGAAVAALIAAALSVGCPSGGGGGGGTTDAGTPSAPAAPTNVSATPGNAEVTLTWTAVSGASSYNVYWSTTPGVTKATGTKIAGAPSPFVHSGLTNGTPYYYVVTAQNSVGESDASTQASATPAVNPPPAEPVGVTVTPGNTENTIAWSPVTGATGYNLYFATAAGVTPATGTKIPNVTSPFVHSGLTNGTAYHYVVTALNANGESAPSAEMSATPAALPFVRALILSVVGGGVPPFGFLEQVKVCTDSTCMTDIPNATVTVNGSPLSFDATKHQFIGTSEIAPGASVRLQVSTGGATTATADATQFTTAPTVTAPTSGATWQAANANTISWTEGSPTTGASNVIGVVSPTGAFVFPPGDHGPMELAIGMTSATVPAATLTAGSYQVMVGIGTTGLVGNTGGISIPNTAAGSGMWLGLIAPFVPITAQ